MRGALCTHPDVPHILLSSPPTASASAATYNPTVALLESSSLAQIAMLSFGMRLRFTTHLLVRPS